MRGRGQKAQPLCGKSSKLGGCLEAGGGRWRKTAIYGTFKGARRRKKAQPLSGKSSELGGCLEAGGGRRRKKIGEDGEGRRKKRASLGIPARL